MSILDFFKNKRKETAPTAAASEAAGIQQEDVLGALLKKYHKEQTNDHLRNILLYLRGGHTVWVPMNLDISEADIAKFLNASKGDTITTSNQIGMRPDYMRTPDGSLFYPMFSSRKEAPADYAKHFSWINMNTMQCVQLALKNPNLSGVVLNPLSTPLNLPKDILQIVAASVESHVIEQGVPISLLPVTEAEQPLMEAAVYYLRYKPEVHKAFLARMRNRGEESIVFIIDAPGADFGALFSEMHTRIWHIPAALPIDYADYPHMEPLLLAWKFEPFYSRDQQ